MSKSTNISYHFFDSSYRFTDIKFVNFLLSKSMSMSRSIICAIAQLDAKCQCVQMSPTHFSSCLNCFRDITLLKCCLSRRSSKVTKCNFRNYKLHHSMAMSKSTAVFHKFLRYFSPIERFTNINL